MKKMALALGVLSIVGLLGRGAHAAPKNKDWGAIAFSSPKAIYYGWAVNYDSKADAEKAAVKKCNEKEEKFTKGKQTCKIHEWFHGECGALAIHPDAKGNIDKFGWAQAPSKDDAEKAALGECRKAGGTSCRIEVGACNKQ